MITPTDPKQLVYMYRCTRSTLKVNGKLNFVSVGKYVNPLAKVSLYSHLSLACFYTCNMVHSTVFLQWWNIRVSTSCANLCFVQWSMIRYLIHPLLHEGDILCSTLHYNMMCRFLFTCAVTHITKCETS